MITGLPKTVDIAGEAWEIRSDFRVILDIIEVLNDEKIDDRERGFFALGFFYPKFREIQKEHMEEAIKMLFWFIRGGVPAETEKKPKLMDWQQDYQYIIAPINRVAGKDIRESDYVHWWTFLSAYMEIGDCVFSQIVSIRKKLAAGKPLGKYEQEWYRENKSIVDLEVAENLEEEAFLKQWGGE